VLIRTWNVFHGRTSPPGRKAYLREMVELAVADRPDFVCLQEVPVWALNRVGAWAGMQSVWMRTRRPLLAAPVGRAFTSLHAGIFRAGFGGQGNVILIRKDATIRETKGVTLNTNAFVEEQGARLGIDPKRVRRWERERRVCQLVKLELPDRRRYLVANLHATSAGDRRLADAEAQRAARFVDRQAEVDELVLLAGDFNIEVDASQTIRELLAAPPESRWVNAAGWIDHILVRNGTLVSTRVWDESERTFDGRVLSDHAPVDAVVEPLR
jgi:endonuclease/exonuclease/phosphatase family metal-dependent hydrolase